VEYVIRYTEQGCHGYKMAAFWAGQSGSLLLWAWLLAAMSSLFVFFNRKQNNAQQAVAIGTLAVVIAFFRC